MNLTVNFTLEELIASPTAARAGIDNTPGPAAIKNLTALAVGLESVRKLLGNRPMHINSGYRCLRVNTLVGSKPTSAHVSGLAADFICPQLGNPLEICKAIRDSHIQFDQVICEFYDPVTRGGWVHFAVAHPGLVGRRETLTIDKTGTRYGLEDKKE